MTYKAAITAANTALAADPARLFLGYGITKTFAMDTLRGVPPAQLYETPVAENLMAGMAIGLSLTGRKPVVYFERCDFILNALDAIVNHLNALPTISRGEFTPAVIFRIVVGNVNNPLYTGETHTQDFSYALESMVDFPVIRLTDPDDDIAGAYAHAAARADQGISTAIFEYKENY